MAKKRKCFEHFSDKEIRIKRQNTIPKATLKNNEKWEHAFRCYLEESGAENSEYWYYPDEELDQVLSKFWFDVHTQKEPLSEEKRREALSINEDPYEERYSIASLWNLQNGLSRSLAQHVKILT